MKNKQKVELKHITPLSLAADATRYGSTNKSDTTEFGNCLKCDSQMQVAYGRGLEVSECVECGYTQASNTPIGSNDFELLKKVVLEDMTLSALEHSMISYHIKCSRTMLQELGKFNLSLAVKPLEDTFEKIKKEKGFYLESDWHCQETEVGKRAAEYVKFTGVDRTDHNSIIALERLRDDLDVGVSNGVARYCLPESLWTEVQLTISLKKLIHFLRKATTKDNLPELSDTAFNMLFALTDDYKELILCDKKIAKQLKDEE